jgi:regulator of replication initiation timing
MSDKINETIKSVIELKSGIGLFSRELEKIHSQLEELKSILAAKQADPTTQEQQVSKPAPIQKKTLVVRREDQEEVELLDNKGYQIHVVGLGIQKLE